MTTLTQKQILNYVYGKFASREDYYETLRKAVIEQCVGDGICIALEEILRMIHDGWKLDEIHNFLHQELTARRNRIN